MNSIKQLILLFTLPTLPWVFVLCTIYCKISYERIAHRVGRFKIGWLWDARSNLCTAARRRWWLEYKKKYLSPANCCGLYDQPCWWNVQYFWPCHTISHNLLVTESQGLCLLTRCKLTLVPLPLRKFSNCYHVLRLLIKHEDRSLEFPFFRWVRSWEARCLLFCNKRW